MSPEANAILLHQSVGKIMSCRYVSAFGYKIKAFSHVVLFVVNSLVHQQSKSTFTFWGAFAKEVFR
jgi:hypothetical protein